MKDLALYVHIPFCKSKCKYCDFCSFQNKDELIEKYVDALCLEINSYKEKMTEFNVKTIYIGGGTPSYIQEEYIEKIVRTIENNFCISSNIEFSIEVNPGTVTERKFDLYKTLGINRISFGLQSTNDTILNELGRIHTFEEFYSNFELARKKGFNNISIDLMFGLPNQTMEIWNETLCKINELKPEHVSAYSLKVEENTLFYKLYQENKLKLPTEELERHMYHECINRLKSFGYNQYEISNFSITGYESKHNISYWERKDYLGVGLNAASCINDIRFSNETDIEKYVINSPKNIVIYKEELDKKEILNERIMLNLRMLKGVDIDLLFYEYDDILKKKFNKNMEYLIKIGLIEKNKNIIKLTTRGIDLSNQVFIKLMDI